MGSRSFSGVSLGAFIGALAASSCMEPTGAAGSTASRELALGAAGAFGGAGDPGAAGAGPTDPVLPIDVWLYAPDVAITGAPTSILAEVSAWNGWIANVDFALSLAGTFSLDWVDVYSPGAFTCGEAVQTPDGATISCHSDLLEYYGDVYVGLTPTADGAITTTAHLSVDGVELPGQVSTTTARTPDDAELSIAGQTEYSALVGQVSRAWFEVYNAGPLAAEQAALSLGVSGPATPTSVWCYSWSTGEPAACVIDGTTGSCSLGSPGWGDGFSCYLDYLPTAEGEITLSASVASALPDYFPEDNVWIAQAIAATPRFADVAIDLQASKPAIVGRPLTYTITATNRGPDGASWVYVEDWLPEGATVVSITPTQGSCAYDYYWPMVACDLGPLEAGASATISVVLTPELSGTITSSVDAHSWGDFETDPDSANNTASLSVDVRGGGASVEGRRHGPPTKDCPLWPGLPIDDLDDGDPFGRHGLAGWFLFNDGTATQVPSSPEGLVVPGGPGSSRYMAQSSGDSFWYWGAGFGIGFECHDASRFTGVEFDALAPDGQVFYVELAMSELQEVQYGGTCEWGCNDFYRAEIWIGGNTWYHCTAPFSALSQGGWGRSVPFNPGTLMSVQFNIETWNTPYDLAVDNLRFAATPATGVRCVPLAR